MNGQSVRIRARSVLKAMACSLVCASATVPLYSTALAATAQGRVLAIMPLSLNNDELFFIKVETMQSSPATPACNTTGRFTMLSTSARYKPTFAVLLAAYHAQTPIWVYGAGTCNNWSNSEDIAYICSGETSCN